MKVPDPWQTISNMAHEARENGGYSTLPTPDGHSLLKLWRMGPVTRFFIGAEEVSGAAFEDEVQVQWAVWQLLKEGRASHQFAGGVEDSELLAAHLTKRELAEIHVLAGVLASIPDLSDAVYRTKQAVGLLMGEWAERDTDA
jgi:hypothetical protein